MRRANLRAVVFPNSDKLRPKVLHSLGSLAHFLRIEGRRGGGTAVDSCAEVAYVTLAREAWAKPLSFER